MHHSIWLATDIFQQNILYPIKIPTLSTQGVTIAAPGKSIMCFIGLS